ncbi:NADPH-dependent F420 reductase [Arthrobacter sp. USHLN218]|uniref:NADPH-dependent F420 reductase n=1 Tax=Arthrobacter sp. USHLN218 TaxID=3081232 RepID=UPI003017B84D
MSPTRRMRIGILGSVGLGSAMARLAVNAGHAVRVATGSPVRDAGAVPGTALADPVGLADADLILLAVPLRKYCSVDRSALAGKIVIDAMNYRPATDGFLAGFEVPGITSSEVVQASLPTSHVVKSLNRMSRRDLDEACRLQGTAGRRAVALAGDDRAAKDVVGWFIDSLGYDPVDAGPLTAGRLFHPGTEIFNGSHTAEQLQALLSNLTQPASA